MKLAELLKGVEVLSYSGDLNIEISGITYDSRETCKGDMFICVSGYTKDGHQYIGEALEKGASALLVEKDVDFSEAAVVKVRSSRDAMAILSANFYEYPAEKLRLIGITGTTGRLLTTYGLLKINIGNWG